MKRQEWGAESALLPAGSEAVASVSRRVRAFVNGFDEKPDPPKKVIAPPLLERVVLPRILDVLENTTDCVALLNDEWRFTFLNRHAVATIGRGKDLVGRALFDVFRSERGTRHWSQTELAARSRKSTHFEFFASHLAKWLEVHVHPLPSGLQIVFRDVTSRKAAIDAIQESEERLRLALEAAGDGAWDWNIVTGRITRSPKLVRRLGYDPDTFSDILADALPLIHPDDLPDLHERLEDHMSGRTEAFAAEFRMKSVQGEWVWFRDRGRVVERDPVTGQATRMIGTGSDITDKKQAELELQRVQSELVHLSRLSGMGAMASTLAHELNQPLIAIANFARGIRHLSNREGKELFAEALDSLEEEAQRAGAIVRRLREYVTRGELERRPESIVEILRESCALALVDAAVMGVEYRIEASDRLPKVLADKIQIQQVLHNLIRNAIEAMKESSGERRLRITAQRRGKREVEVCVTDSGPGIAEAIRGQLFTPFVTTKAEGMGVGLSICRTIIEAHDGRISVAAPPGGGTEFRFTLEAV